MTSGTSNIHVGLMIEVMDQPKSPRYLTSHLETQIGPKSYKLICSL